jgi:hypothetical protein
MNDATPAVSRHHSGCLLVVLSSSQTQKRV